MEKQKKTGKQIADIVSSRINVGGVFVSVNPDDTLGWHAQIIAAPSATFTYQTYLEKLLPELRAQYELIT